MSYQEKNNFAALVSSIVVFGVYYAFMIHMYGQGHFDGPDAMSLVGQYTLWLIGGSIVITIIATILFNIVYAIATKDGKPSFVVDERDRLIELRGLQVSTYVTGAGFIISMAALAWSIEPFIVFNMIILSFAVGNAVSILAKLHLYKRGY